MTDRGSVSISSVYLNQSCAQHITWPFQDMEVFSFTSSGAPARKRAKGLQKAYMVLARIRCCICHTPVHMAERPSFQPNPEQLLQLKDGILDRWGQLPAEHQATLMLVLFQQTLEGEYGPWVRSAIRLLGQQDADGPFRFMPVVNISPSHLANANLTEDEILNLDAEDLKRISYDIVRHYTNDVFWEELEFISRLVLAEKRSAKNKEADGMD